MCTITTYSPFNISSFSLTPLPLLSSCSKGHDFSQQNLNILYVTRSAQFPEVETFVEESVARYFLAPVRISGMGIKNALCQLKQSHPHFKAIMMGTRHTDPFSGIECSTHLEYVQYFETYLYSYMRFLFSLLLSLLLVLYLPFLFSCIE